jgi:hypothetical protein
MDFVQGNMNIGFFLNQTSRSALKINLEVLGVNAIHF